VFGNNDRLLKHNGTGNLGVAYLDMGAGTFVSASAAYGGCIYSKGSVSLTHSSLNYCYAHSTGAKAGGGAVRAASGVVLDGARVVDSVAKSNTSTAHGGGILAGGLQSSYSTVSGNKAVGFTTSTGGGTYIVGTTSMTHTTISSNSAGFLAGGMLQQGGASFTMTLSTISGNNVTSGVVGGVAVIGPPTVTIDNSTIAFNTASISSFNAKLYAPGLAVITSGADMTAKVRSTIISNNSYGNYDFDFSQNPGGASTITFEPASNSNLIRAPGSGSLPADTILFACPDLGRLRSNGGVTQTHSLNSNSIAIDNGSNPDSFTHDQRGVAEDTTLYPRVSNGVADIGAYEVNQADIVFTNAFEACRPLSSPLRPNSD